MTDRFHTLTVVLESDTRTDDAEALITAIEQMRGVLKVSGVVSDMDSHMAQERVRRELGEKLWAVLYPTPED
jgi:nitrate reductase NapAB chaperone NapD